MSYEKMGESSLEYLPCRYGESRLLFRGPRKRMDAEYIAFLGGSETYGKFVSDPFPSLVENALGRECVNFGLMNAGIDVFAEDQAVMEAARGASVTVIQLVGAQNMSNRFYTVHPRRNDRFINASNVMKAVFRDVDFTEFHFTRHMLQTLKEVASDRFEMLREELRQAWQARMRHLISQIEGKIVLLWVQEDSAEASDLLGQSPLFIDEAMVANIAPLVEEVVHVIPSDEARATGTEGMVFNEMEVMAANKLLNPKSHEEIAAALEECLQRVC